MSCDFCNISTNRIIFDSESFFVIEDGYPVSAGHLLIILKEHKTDFFNLTNDEHSELNKMILKAKELIEKNHKPDGYNIGMNCGESAGQTVMHFHCHIIPRYKGDTENPRGGVRGAIPDKMDY